MERSLTVLLPVENAQSTLAATVHRVLDVLPELTCRFELVIVDDGSTDATIEVADELATEYPQVQVIRHAVASGRTSAIQSGIQQSVGEILFLMDHDCLLPVDDVHQLWNAMDRHDVVLGRSVVPGWRKGPFRRLDTPTPPGFQMLRRRAAKPLWECLGHQLTLRAELLRTDARWFEIELGAGSTPPGRPQTGHPKRPNYLQSIKDFALGE